MSEVKTSEIKRPLNAPGFMRPRQTVLDEPLEFGVERHTPVIPQPAFQAAPVELVTPVTDTEPEPSVELPVDAQDSQNEGLIFADMSAEEVLAQTSSGEQTQPAEFVAETTVEETQSKPNRKLSGFQRFILFLLVVFVMLTLATVFLYVTGRIELPDTVIVVIEKGLKLIQ
jgi:hypothetical protein